MFKVSFNSKNTILVGIYSALAVFTTWLAVLLRSIESMGMPTPVNPYALFFVIFCLSYLVVNGSYNSIKEYKDKVLQNDRYKRFAIIGLILLLAMFILRYFINGYVLTSLQGEEMLFWKHLYFTVAISVKYFIFLFIALTISYSIKAYLTQSKFKLQTMKSGEKSIFQTLLLIFSFILFLSIKVFFLTRYQGMYEDNWLHILAAKDFFKTGQFTELNEFFADKGYLRGSYVSLSASFVCNYISCKLIVLRAIPTILGLFSFVALYKVLKSLINKPWIIALTLILYSINPFTIFNHLNLRMYVFYELFVLIGILVTISAIKNIKINRIKSVIQILLLLLAGAAMYNFSYDRGAVIILIFTALSCIFYGFVFVSSFDLNRIIDFINLRKKLFYTAFAAFFFVLIAITIIYLQQNSLLDITKFLPKTNVSSQNGHLLFILFNYYNFLILGTIVPIIFFDKLPITLRYVSFVAGAMLLLHSFAPADYQLMRGFNYAWPIFYITLSISVLILSQMLQFVFVTVKKRSLPGSNLSSKLIVSLMISVISIAMVLFTARSYSSYFLSVGPSIHGEVAYYEFEKAFKFIETIDEDTILIESSINFFPNNYFNIEPDFILQTKEFYETKVLTIDKPILNSYQEAKIAISDRDACYIIRDSAPGLILDKPTYLKIKKDNVKHFTTQGFEIYCNYSK